MNWIVFGVQWLHVLLGIIWFGNALVVAVILIPSLNPLPIPTQREVGTGTVSAQRASSTSLSQW